MKENKFRCHFSIVIENVFSAIWLVVLLAMGEIIDEVKNIRKGYVVGNNLIVLYILLAIIFIVLIVNILFWRKTYIFLDGKSLVVEKNTIISKKSNTIAMKNISNVNLEQNIFERFIGTYKIKIDTNSSSTAEETDVKIILKKNKADIFRKSILNSIEKTSPELINEKDDEDIYTIKYSLKDVILHSIYSTPISIGIYGGIVVVSLIINQFSNENKNIDEGIVQMLLGILVIFIPIVYSLCKNLFKFYGFKVGRKGDKIYINYGLMTKKQYTVPVDKINAIVIDEPTISRIFKKKSIELVNIGMGDNYNESAQVLLSEGHNKYKEKLKLILPEVELNENLKRQSKKVFYNNASYVIINLICIGIFSMFTTMWFMLYMILPVIYYVLKYITYGIRIDENYLAVATGFFRKRTKYITYDKIQNISFIQGPISKKNNIAKCNIFILSSLINNVSCTGYYNIEELEKINDKI